MLKVSEFGSRNARSFEKKEFVERPLVVGEGWCGGGDNKI